MKFTMDVAVNSWIIHEDVIKKHNERTHNIPDILYQYIISNILRVNHSMSNEYFVKNIEKNNRRQQSVKGSIRQC